MALYECGPLRFSGADDIYDRHLVFDHGVSLEGASDRERFEAVARALRDLLTQRCLLTKQTYEAANAKGMHRSVGVIVRLRTIIWATMLASLLGASASNARTVYAQDHMGSVNDYLSTSPDFPEGDEFLPLGIAVINGEGTLKGGHRFDGVEIVGVAPSSPGAAAGLKGRQERLQTLMNVGMITASIFFPPAMLGAALLGSTGIGESHEFIIAVDGVRTHDVIEFDEALNQAEAGEIVYLTIVRNGQRKQIRVVLAGRRSGSSSFSSKPNS